MHTCGGELELCACSKPRGQNTQLCICITGTGESLEVSKESRFEICIGSFVDSLRLWRAEEQSGWLRYGTWACVTQPARLVADISALSSLFVATALSMA
jgi:hypothetical protein